MKTRTLDAAFALKALTSTGAFEGYASIFDVEDRLHEVVTKGAFEKTLREHRVKGRLPAMLWQHDTRDPVGVWREMREDEVGLYVRGQLFIEDIARARQAHALLRENALSGLSIGFRTVRSAIEPKTGVRTLTEIELFEVSLVTFPAHDAARVHDIKAMLRSGRVPDARQFESFLRDAGLSRRQAKALMADGYRALSRRDAADPLLRDLVARAKRVAGHFTDNEA